jgi:hypothetical protein
VIRKPPDQAADHDSGRAWSPGTSGSGSALPGGCMGDSGMQGGPVDEFLDVAVECAGLEQFEVEVGRIVEDRVITGLTGDHGEECHLGAVDQSGGPSRVVDTTVAGRFIIRVTHR